MSLRCHRSRVGRSRWLSGALAQLALVSWCAGVSGPTSVSVTSLGTNSEGKQQFQLGWNSVAGAAYKVQSRAAFDPSTPWTTRDVVTAEGSRETYLLTVSESSTNGPSPHQFYQIVLPAPEIFQAQPSLLAATGGVFYLVGQCFTSNDIVRVDGVPVLSTVFNGYDLLRVTAGSLAPGTHTLEVVDSSTGATNASLKSGLTVVSGSALPADELPMLPPGAPVSAGNPVVQRENEASVADATGEFIVASADLVIPGRGLDFIWARTYRSRSGLDTALGKGWDFSYNISAQPSGANVVVHDGNGRLIVFLGQGDGTFSREGYFREGKTNAATGEFELTFADKGVWKFFVWDGSGRAGKIHQSVDRNGNTISFAYDPTNGRLTNVIDTLNRSYLIANNSGGLVSSVTDFSGRVVRYEYDANTNLVRVISPAVTGTPNGNDFPNGKTNAYTYSSGFADERLNHNLLTITDGKGQTWLQNTFATNTSPLDVNYDRLVSQAVGESFNVRTFSYIPQTPAPSNRFAVIKTIENDMGGNVTERMFDSRGRPVGLREFTGYSGLGSFVTETQNRPLFKLRDSDPEVFVTAIEWNRDSLPTKIMWPRGNSLEMVYESDFNVAANPRERGNVRIQRERDLSPQTQQIVQAFEHQPGLGTPEGERRLARRIWAGGRGDLYCLQQIITDPHRRAFGNFPPITIPIPETAPGGDFMPGLADVGAGSGGYVNFDYGFRGFDPSWWGATTRSLGENKLGSSAQCFAGAGNGGTMLQAMPALFQDFFVFGSFEHAQRGTIDRGSADRSSWTAVNSCTDGRGNVWTFNYDANGNLTRAQGPLAGAVTDYEYNPSGQLTAIVHPPNSGGQRRRDEISYYESGPQLGYPQHLLMGANGGGFTTTLEYDVIGNLTRLTDPRGNSTEFARNALNQIIRVTRHAAGPPNSIQTDFSYDANNNVVRIDTDNKDEYGNAQSNAQFTTRFDYDVLNFPVRVSREVDATTTNATQFSYDGKRNLIGVQLGEAVAGHQACNRMLIAYDERDLPYGLQRGGDFQATSGSRFDYDANGNLVTGIRGLGGGDADASTNRFAYDGFDRLVAATNSVGTVSLYHYLAGAWGGIPLYADAEVFGGGIVLEKHHVTYDAMNYKVRWGVQWFDANGAPIGDGESATRFSYAPNHQLTRVEDDLGGATEIAYDVVNRPFVVASFAGASLVSLTSANFDLNGNVMFLSHSDKSETGSDQNFTVMYAYDRLNRRISTTDNVGNVNSFGYDSRGNIVRHTDANGHFTQHEYDGLNRLVRTGRDLNNFSNAFQTADLVMAQTWDASSRLTSRTDDNGHTTQFAYDCLNRLASVTAPDGTMTFYAYDRRDNVIRVQDANGTTTTNTYDVNDRLVRRDIVPGAGVAPGTTFENYQYDGLGRLVRAENNGATNTFAYDSLGHVVRETQNGQSLTSSYDSAGNRLSLTYPHGQVVSYYYDAASRLKSVQLLTPPATMPDLVASNSYVGSRIEKVERGNGTRTLYAYDGRVGPPVGADKGWGRVSYIGHLRTNFVPFDERTFEWDRAQNKTRRLATYFGATRPEHRYVYDNADRLVEAMAFGTSGLVRDTSYTLDGADNRLNVSGAGTPHAGAYTLNSNNPPADFQVDQYTITPLGTNTYDANGNRTRTSSAGADSIFSYDYANRLVAISNALTSQVVIRYFYDPLGRRIRADSALDGPMPQTRKFFYDGEDVLEESDPGGGTQRAWIYMPCWAFNDGGRLLESLDLQFGTRIGTMNRRHNVARASSPASSPGVPPGVGAGSGTLPQPAAGTGCATRFMESRSDGTKNFFHADDLGNVMALTDATGNVVERYEYQDFGEPEFYAPEGTPRTNSAVPYPFLFSGLKYDSAAGLYWCDPGGSGVRPPPNVMLLFNASRCFDPRTGTSFSRRGADAVGNARSYAGNNPYSRPNGAIIGADFYNHPKYLLKHPGGAFMVYDWLRRAGIKGQWTMTIEDLTPRQSDVMAYDSFRAAGKLFSVRSTDW